MNKFEKELQLLKSHDQVQFTHPCSYLPAYNKIITAGHGYLIVPAEDKQWPIAWTIAGVCLYDGIQLLMNTHSGNVFLCDADYNVCMLNGDKLEMFLTCSNCGNEGFASEITLSQNKEYCSECEDKNK